MGSWNLILTYGTSVCNNLLKGTYAWNFLWHCLLHKLEFKEKSTLNSTKFFNLVIVV